LEDRNRLGQGPGIEQVYVTEDPKSRLTQHTRASSGIPANSFQGKIFLISCMFVRDTFSHLKILNSENRIRLGHDAA